MNTMQKPPREATDWNDYSRSFQSVMPSGMTLLNEQAAEFLHGDVIDYGCGAGKALPFVIGQPEVRSYTGVDASAQMIAGARWMAKHYKAKRIELVEGFIEDVSLSPSDSALSINSFYVWSEPRKALAKIHSQLKSNGTFVLASINSSLDMALLLKKVEPEMIAHPHWQEFKEHNLKIANSGQINLMSLDQMINMVRELGFEVMLAHTQLYEGGINFLVLRKAS